jgi:uncharacterized protein YbjQ (UPF0145 family)
LKRITTLALALSAALLFCAPSLHAADEWQEFPAAAAIKSPLGQKKLLPTIQVFMKGQSHPGIVKKFREFKTNQRSSKFGKSVQEACDTAFLSGLIALQKRAEREGGNAVVDIYTITKNKKFESPENYQCIAGSMISNVALMGTVVTLRH